MGARHSKLLGRGDPKAIYRTEERGKPNTLTWRLYLRNEQGPLSMFHDVPLYYTLEEDSEVNMVVELPRWSNVKLEVATREPLNPIMHDSFRGRLRYVANLFPYHGVPWNYGALPQTWENPRVVDTISGCRGDNDPVDAIDIGDTVAEVGEVVKVKVLGALALIDQGESDWKIIVINVKDPLVTVLNDINDVDVHRPGLLNVTVDWFRFYKIPEGKSENSFAFEGKAKGRVLAMRIILDMHHHWLGAVMKRSRVGGIIFTNTLVKGSHYRISVREAEDIISRSAVPTAPRPVPAFVDAWYFLRDRNVEKLWSTPGLLPTQRSGSFYPVSTKYSSKKDSDRPRSFDSRRTSRAVREAGTSYDRTGSRAKSVSSARGPPTSTRRQSQARLDTSRRQSLRPYVGEQETDETKFNHSMTSS